MAQMLIARKVMRTRDLETGPAAVAAAVAPSPRYPQGLHLLVGFVIFGIGFVLAYWLLPSVFPKHVVAFTPTDGVTAFALFFLAATAVERSMEPFSSGLVRATPQPSAGTDGTAGSTGSATAEAAGTGALNVLGKTKAEAQTMRSSLLASVVNGTSTDPDGDTKKAAAEQATASQAVVNATFVLWAVATTLAVVVVFYFGLSLPKALGVTSGTNTAIDQFLTAVVVGAGTKPLHDFFSNIQKSSQGSDDSSSGGASTT